jgi:hypothetical protein
MGYTLPNNLTVKNTVSLSNVNNEKAKDFGVCHVERKTTEVQITK